MTALHTHHLEHNDEIEIVEVTPEEYAAAIQRDLAKLGLTYEALAAQARTGVFSSPDARALWLRIKPLGPRQDLQSRP